MSVDSDSESYMSTPDCKTTYSIPDIEGDSPQDRFNHFIRPEDFESSFEEMSEELDEMIDKKELNLIHQVKQHTSEKGYARLRDYLWFLICIDKFMCLTTSEQLWEKIKVHFYNKLLLGCLQEDLTHPHQPRPICSYRTAIQYLIETLNALRSWDL